jgi:anti-sigma B factor antagonist
MSLTDFQPSFFDFEAHDDVAVATFQIDQLTDELNIEQLGAELFSLVDHYNFDKVILNMRVVEFLNSSVLGKMITMHRKLHRKDGKLVICHLTSGVSEVMHTSRLIGYFHVVDDFDAAIAVVN